MQSLLDATRGRTVRSLGRVCLALVWTVASSACDEAPVEPSSQKKPADVPVDKAPASQPKSAGSGSSECRAICTTAVKKGCDTTTEECLQVCAEMGDMGACQLQMQATLECMARTPVAGWECGPSGFPELAEGRCNTEQAAFARCVSGQ